MTIRVLITDDDPLVRAGLAMILGGAPDVTVVGEAGDGAQACRAVEEAAGGAAPVDVVLMDIRMPVRDGIAATEILAARTGGPRVIVLTTFDADDYVLRALAAGADGFLLKDTPPEQIVAAVRAVHAGDPMLSPAVTARLIDQVTDTASDARARTARERTARLTEREREVAVAVGQGLANAEIAAALHMSVATVKAHLAHCFGKLEAANRVQVAITVHHAGLL